MSAFVAKKNVILVLAALALVAGGAPSLGRDLPQDTSIVGDYMEARTSDVYVGPCFANSEVNLAGQEAVMAWKVREGSWQGVALEGLSVVAVVRANATLGDPHADPTPAQAVVVVDAKASREQRTALVELARAEAGALLDAVVAVETAPIAFDVGHHGAAALHAGEIAALTTRSLHEDDKICGYEELYYGPLTDIDHAHPGYTLTHEWKGPGLGTTWKSPHKRSAFVGEFSR